MSLGGQILGTGIGEKRGGGEKRCGGESEVEDEMQGQSELGTAKVSKASGAMGHLDAVEAPPDNRVAFLMSSQQYCKVHNVMRSVSPAPAAYAKPMQRHSAACRHTRTHVLQRSQSLHHVATAPLEPEKRQLGVIVC